jgi:probable F420-dependent oxidoreductase
MESIKMGIGFGLWQQGIPDATTLFEYIDKAEAWGIDSVWLSDHMLGERSEVAIMPMMAAIAARTHRLKFGPSVMMLPLRHPIAIAKDIATLEFLFSGRVIMAVGLGADEQEANAFNVPLKYRGSITDEGIEILRKLWSGSHVSHHGKHFHFADVTITPRPTKKIDIWIGGRSEAALRRVARLGDGWFASFVTPQEFAEGEAKIAEYAGMYGRAEAHLEAGSIVFCHVDSDSNKARRDFTAFFAGNRRRPPEQMLARSAVGTPEECREVLQRYVEHGLTKFALWPACPPPQLLQQLAYYAQDIIPHFEQRERPVATHCSTG